MAIRVVDTDVLSYLYKGRDEAKLYQPHILGNTLVISFQTQADLLRWSLVIGTTDSPISRNRHGGIRWS